MVTCVICKFYNKNPRGGDGWCHRYPPTMVKVDLFRWTANHVEVSETDYCGEGIINEKFNENKNK